MGRTKAEGEQTRQAILDAALTTFSEQGYETARLQDIAEAIGTTRGAIYHHFNDGKKEIIRTLFEEVLDEITAVIQQVVEEGGTVREMSARALITSWTSLEENRRRREVVAMLNKINSNHPDLADLIQISKADFQKDLDLATRLAREGVEKGELRADIDPEMLARAHIAYSNGIVSIWLADQTAFSLKESAPALAAIFVKGVSAE